MNAKIQKVFAACMLAMSFLFFTSSSMAQTIQVSGRCITGTITLSITGTYSGKNLYEGTGTVLGFPGVGVGIYWEGADSKWYLAFDGQPYFQNADNTTIPNSTNIASWTATVDNTDCLTGPALSISGTGTGDREINVKQNTTNIIDGGSFNFGNVNLNSNSSLPFTIENQGTVTLTLTGTPPNFVTKGGTNPGDFTITQPATGTIAAQSNTTFTVVFTPGGSGARSCTLQIPNNDGDEAPYDITLNGTGVCSVPACSITFTNPPPWGQDSACANTTGNIHAAPGGMSAYNWSISGGGTITSGTTGSSVTVTAGNSGSYNLSVTVTDANGCTSTCTDQTPIKPAPTCDLTGPDPVCGNSTGNVYSVDNGSFTISSYTWSISGDGTIVGSSTGSSITVTAGASGAYTVNVTSMGFNSCASFCSKTVTINSAGSPTITGPTSVCSGGSVTLDAGAGYAGYTWSNGGGSGQTATFSNITSPTTYTVTVSNNGCTGTDTHLVNVNAAPVCSVAGADNVCNNTPGNTYTAPAGMTSYNWGITTTGNSTIQGSTTGQSVSVTAGDYLQDYTVSVTITNANGCTSTCSKQSFTYLQKPQADITANPSPACFGVAIDLSVAAAASSTVAWTGEGIADPNGNPSTTALPASTGLKTYAVTVTTSAYFGGCSNTGTVDVSVENCNIDFSGKIIFTNNNSFGVNNATVSLTGSATGSDPTDVNGDFFISSGVPSGSFTLKPTKTVNKLNGVTAGDITVIQQHVANILPITDLYKQVAADVNKSNSISTTDASIINQALLGNPVALSQFSTSWRFVPTSHTMTNPPWGFPEQRTYTNINTNQTDQNFYGIKTGDVATTYANPANFGAGQPLVLQDKDRLLQAGETFAVEFSAGQTDDLAAFQCVLRFDPGQLQFVEIQPLTGLPLTMDNFGTYNLAEGEIRLVWAQATAGAVAEAAPVFRLQFTALQSGVKLSEVLHLDESELPALAYNSALAESKVELKFSALTGTGSPADAGGVQLFQNRPNPFNGSTTITFVLPEACEAQLRVFDVSGRLLIERKGQYPAGRHEQIFEINGASGLLYYELTTPFGVVAKKMVATGR